MAQKETVTGPVPKQPASFTERHPLFVGTMIAAVKTAAADLLVQTQVEGKPWDEIDWRRNMVFLSFGFGYLGLGMYAVYVKGFSRVFGTRVQKFCAKPFRDKLKDRVGLKLLAVQSFADVVILNPFLYWPSYYSFKALCFSDPAESRSSLQLVSDTITDEYPKTFWIDNLGMGLVWLPANMIIYSVPMHYRLPVMHVASLGWCIILSIMRGAQPEPSSR